MRKPKDFNGEVWQENEGVYILDNYFIYEDLPKLIKWLEKAQKYNEFKNKQKRKKVKDGK